MNLRRGFWRLSLVLFIVWVAIGLYGVERQDRARIDDHIKYQFAVREQCDTANRNAFEHNTLMRSYGILPKGTPLDANRRDCSAEEAAHSKEFWYELLPFYRARAWSAFRLWLLAYPVLWGVLTVLVKVTRWVIRGFRPA